MGRRLRLAAAVYFVLLAVVLMALWVRSYSRHDGISGPVASEYVAGVEHCCGLIVGDLSKWIERPASCEQWTWTSDDAEPLQTAVDYWKSDSALNLGVEFRVRPSNGFAFSFPHWFLAAFSVAFAALFAFKRTWRFTTRGLFIATTVVAAILALTLYAI